MDPITAAITGLGAAAAFGTAVSAPFYLLNQYRKFKALQGTLNLEEKYKPLFEVWQALEKAKNKNKEPTGIMALINKAVAFYTLVIRPVLNIYGKFFKETLTGVANLAGAEKGKAVKQAIEAAENTAKWVLEKSKGALKFLAFTPPVDTEKLIDKIQEYQDRTGLSFKRAAKALAQELNNPKKSTRALKYLNAPALDYTGPPAPKPTKPKKRLRQSPNTYTPLEDHQYLRRERNPLRDGQRPIQRPYRR